MSVLHVSTANDLQTHVQAWRMAGQRIAFVPTMGALHEGHLSLVRLARERGDKVVVSIFVNTTQFAPHEDFDSYPRDLAGDIAKLETVGVDAVYSPGEGEMYPQGYESDIKVGEAAHGLETDFRPHFFDGVVNIVARLFDHVRPDVAVFGEKDYQQLRVICEMVTAQDMDIEIIGAPIARDEHGLALSSRNAYLSIAEVNIARQLNVIIKTSDTPEADLLAAGFDKVDYVEQRWGRVLAAAWLGKTRLIDNVVS